MSLRHCQLGALKVLSCPKHLSLFAFHLVSEVIFGVLRAGIALLCQQVLICCATSVQYNGLFDMHEWWRR